MRRSTYHIALFALFLLIVVLRLSLSLQNPLPDYEAYDNLRQIQSISQSGLPLYHDDLSYGGKERVFPPLFPYLLWFFSLLNPPVLVVKILPNIFMAAIVFPVFFLAKFMTSKQSFAFISAALAGFAPAALLIGINDGSSLALSTLILFSTAYFFLKSRKSGRHLNYVLVCIVVLSLIDSLSAVLLLALLLFLSLQKIERITVRPKEVELVLFYLFFTGWVSLILYKKAFVAHGSSIIWQNIPLAQMSEQFSRITLLEAVGATGLIPLIAGVWALYYALTRTKMKSTLLVTSIISSTIILLWFRLIPLSAGLLLMTIALCLASAYLFMLIHQYFSNTKFSRLASVPIFILLAIFVAVSIPQYSSYQSDSPSPASLRVLEQARGLGEEATVLSLPQEGAFVSYTTGAKNVMDQDYLLAIRVDERYDDVTSLYQDFFKTPAISKMEKYGATHLFVSEKGLQMNGGEALPFVEDSCFEVLASSEQVSLYRLACSLRGGGR